MKRSSRNSACTGSAAVRDPVEGAGLAGGDQARIVDLESGRQVVGNDDAAELRLRLGHLQHHDEALVLPCFARVGRFAGERVVAALDLEAAFAAGSGASGDPFTADDRLKRCRRRCFDTAEDDARSSGRKLR